MPRHPLNHRAEFLPGRRAIDILADSKVIGNLLQIPTQLSSKDYAAVNKLLVALGGTWHRSRQGQAFASDPTKSIAAIVDGHGVPTSHRIREGYVATPAVLAVGLLRNDTDGEV